MKTKSTYSMIRSAAVALVAVAAIAFMAQDASAQHYGHGGHHGGHGIGHGGHGINHGGHGGFNLSIGNSGYGHGGYGRGISVNAYRPAYVYRPAWHNTSHYDYHGPSIQRHGNHYDYVPGHYDYHRTGHWDH